MPSGNGKAFMWVCNNFSEGKSNLEKFAAKFKSKEIAEVFKEKFNAAQ